MSRRRVIHLSLALGLAAAAVAVHGYRRATIASYFERGPGGAPPPALPLPDDPALAADALPPADRVRVVLLDGVDLRLGSELPHLDRLCRDGLDLLIDVGFPTVSLPVQAVLWTGLTQQQSGIQFAVRRLDAPLSGTPAATAGSVAVAEAYPFIVHSLGFERTRPDEDGFEGEIRDRWTESGFSAAAKEAVAGSAPLVFVHVLRADTAGHRHGRTSPEYLAAAAEADAILGSLLAAAPPEPGDRWFVLSDHGHRDRGGHGGAEREIRLVRGCVGGDTGGLAAEPGSPVHLVDVARALADSLDLTLDPRSAGRPLGAALAAPAAQDASIPRPPRARWIIALLLASGGLVWGLVAGRRWWLGPWWWIVGFGSILLLEGSPTLSSPMVYESLGRTAYLAAVPGLLLLALTAGLGLRAAPPWPMTVSLLALPLALAAAARVLSGDRPPLMPIWSAHTSVFLVLLVSGAAVVGLAHLVAAARRGSGQGTGAETPRSEP